jgi:putative transposase
MTVGCDHPGGHSMTRPRDRRTIRLPGYDYGWAATYFVTICTRDRAHVFGDVDRGVVRLNPFGRIAASEWRRIGRHRPGVALDVWVIMPNHLHGVVTVSGNRTPPEDIALLAWRESHRRFPYPRGIRRGRNCGTLGAIVGSYKSATSRRINLLRGAPGTIVWQRGYYEHIVAGSEALERIRQYITNNPARWSDAAAYRHVYGDRPAPGGQASATMTAWRATQPSPLPGECRVNALWAPPSRPSSHEATAGLQR